MKDQIENAANNPIESRNNENIPLIRYYKWCRISSHNISACFKYRDHKYQYQNPPQIREEFSVNYSRRSRHREDNSFNNRFENSNQRNINKQGRYLCPRQFINRTNNFVWSRSQNFWSRDRNFNVCLVDQNNKITKLLSLCNTYSKKK